MSFCKRTLILIATSLFALFVTAWELSAEEPAKNTDSGTAVQRVTLDLKGLVKNWHLLPDNSKLDAIDQLIRQGRPEYAIQLLQQTSFQGAVARKRARFLRAMVLKTTGKYAAAVQEFRGLLANNPEFHRVRMELAHTLFLMKEDKSARHHFELVLGGSRGNPDLSRVVQSYLQAIGSRRRWDFSTYASIAPSTNFNQGSSNRTVQLNGLAFTLDETRVKKSGVGFVAGFQGSYRQPLSDRLDMIFSAGLHAKRFRESFFNDTLGNVSIGPRYRFNNGTLGVYATANKRRYANVDMTDGFGGIVTGSLRLSPSDIVFANVKCTKYIYNEDWRGTDLSYQDGHHCSVSGRFDHYLSDVMYVRALGGYGLLETDRDHLDNKSWTVGLGVYRELPLGISLYMQASATKLDYKGIFPSITEARRDKLFSLSAQVTKRDWNFLGFAPKFQYGYTRNFSNVDFFDYNSHGANLSVTKNF